MESEKFFKGLLYGAVIGAIAGLLLAPRSGSETREDIKKRVNELGDRTTEMYTDAKKQVRRKIKQLVDTGESIDVDSYKELVSKVVDELKNDSEVSSDVAHRLGEKLNSDWNEIRKSFAS